MSVKWSLAVQSLPDYGRYSFAVPLLGDFIRRQYPADQPELFDEESR